MEEEVELLPHSKKEKEPKEAGSKVADAIKVLKEAASEQGVSVEELIKGEGSEEGSMDKSEEAHEEFEGSEEEKEEPTEDKGRKMALYIAQMKSKRG